MGGPARARSGALGAGGASPGGGRSPGTGGRRVGASAGCALNKMRQRLACLTQSVMVVEETVRVQILEKPFNRKRVKDAKTLQDGWVTS